VMVVAVIEPYRVDQETDALISMFLMGRKASSAVAKVISSCHELGPRPGQSRLDILS